MKTKRQNSAEERKEDRAEAGKGFITSAFHGFRASALMLLLLLTIAVTSSCGGGGGGEGGGNGGGGGATLTSISVAPENTSVFRAATKQFTATGSYSDGTTQDITTSVTWSSSDTTIATINGTGLANASSNKSGPTIITATLGSIPRSSQLMVAVNLPKTGQTTSYDANNPRRDDGALQRGVSWPSQRFTDNGATVTDNLTGLMWTKDANAPGPGGCTPSIAKIWWDALSYVVCLNSSNYLGYNDWRLPNRKEIRSLIDYSRLSAPPLPVGHPFNSVQINPYWTSSTYAADSTQAWDIDLSQGAVASFTKSPATWYVWAVRAGQGGAPADLPKTGQRYCYTSINFPNCTGIGEDGDIRAGVSWPNPRFVNPDGSLPVGNMILDLLTGLIWTKDANAPGPGGCNPSGSKTWQEALNYVACLNTNNYLGYSDWRLPNVNELESLVDAEWSNPALPSGHPFSNVVADFYWSSTTSAVYIDNAASVSMYDGLVGSWGKTNYNYSVWPVWGGQ
jgi:hypothetical protein